MRMLAWCLILLGLSGCQSGPRWCSRDCDVRDMAPGDERSVMPPASTSPGQPNLDGPGLSVPPLPSQAERVPYEPSSRSRGWFGSRAGSQASRSKSSNRAIQTAHRGTNSAPAAGQDESVKQLLADLERTKREKAALELKLTDESARQIQQRLELEARLALIQEQLRQQSALQQVQYQPQAPVMSRPTNSYSGPLITSGSSMSLPFSSSPPTYAPPPQSQPEPQGVPAWGQAVPTWNTPSVPPQSQVEQWPFSAQRR
ncbi:MAG: hypothetical protein ACKV2Q_06905 [Planctomycetaceae bacterium]